RRRNCDGHGYRIFNFFPPRSLLAGLTELLSTSASQRYAGPVPRSGRVLCLTLLAILGVISAPVGHAQTAPRTPVARPLHTDGARFLDAENQEVRVTGVNWFGLETDTFAPHGLWARNYGDMLDQIAAAGFNTVRLPFSNQLFDAASAPHGIDYGKNPELKGL